MKILYNNCDIPARYYYEMMHSGDYSKMGEGTHEELEAAFDVIVDEHFTLYPNEKAIEWFRSKANIEILQLSVFFIKKQLYELCFSQLSNEEKEEIVSALNKLSTVKVKFDIKKDFYKEVDRVQNIVIGFLENQANAELVIKKEQGEKQAYNFYDDLNTITTALMIYLPDDISLHRFESCKKQAMQRSKPNNQPTE